MKAGLGMRSRAAASTLRCFVLNVQGTSGIEFGILAPLLLLMLLGTIELGRAIDNDRRFVAAASTIGDLVAREEYLGTDTSNAGSNLAGMMKSLEALMAPYDSSEANVIVSSVRVSATDDSKAKVDWSYSSTGDGAHGQCSDFTLPANMIDKGGSVIVVEATSKYHTLFGSYVPGMQSTMTWAETSYHSPRNKCVDYVKGDNCTAAC